MSHSELSQESVAGEKRENKIEDMSRKAIFKKLDQLEKKLDKAIGNASDQPSSHITVWGADGPPDPGSTEIAGLIKEVKQRSSGVGMDRNQVQQFLGLKKKRTLEVMKELGAKHPDLSYKDSEGNQASRLMVPSTR